MLTNFEFEHKDTFFKVLDLITSMVTLCLEGVILVLVIMRTKFLPFFVIGSILNSIFEIITNVKLLYVAIIKLKKLNNIMEVTREEMEEEDLDHTCIICQHEIDTGKMLECRHVFHIKCLKKWILTENNCPTCKREDVVFVPDDKICALKQKIITKRNLRDAGIEDDDFIDEIESAKGNNDEALKSKYKRIEKDHLRKRKHKSKKKAKNQRKKKYGPDTDSEDTDEMIMEVQQVERKITFMMNEIMKARLIVEKYDKKLTRRLDRKRQRRLEAKKRKEEERLSQGLPAQNPNPTQEELIEQAVYAELDRVMDERQLRTQAAQAEFKQGMTEPSMDPQMLPSPMDEIDKSHKKGSVVKRLKDYDLAPQKSESLMVTKDPNRLIKEAEKIKFEEDRKSDGGDDEEEDDLEESTHRSAPDVESIKNPTKLDMSHSKFKNQAEVVKKDESINSQNGEQVMKLTQPNYSHLMHASKNKSKKLLLIFLVHASNRPE